MGAIRAASERGGVDHVWVDETRPLLQGARLTAFELEALGIPHAVIVDGAAASRMAAGEVDIVITGADRIAANGDTANKIGTYGLAVLAHHHGIPFVIVAPTSTIDPTPRPARAIPIEERDGAEVTTRFAARNPAFDVTPAELITAIVTEEGVHRAPYADSLPAPVRLAMILDEVDRGARAILERYGFDAERVRAAPRRARRRHADGGATSSHGVVEPPLPSDLTSLPAPGEPGFDGGGRGGSRGAPGRDDRVVVLAGGHGDALRRRRQGGRGGGRRTQLPRGQARRDRAARATALGAEIPVALMTSFATDEAVASHVAEQGLGQPLWFGQTAAPRLRPDGSLFRDADGRASLYGPGHGDSLGASASSGALASSCAVASARSSSRTSTTSPARIDPVVVGMHVLARNAAHGRGRCEGRRHGRRAGAGRRPAAAARGDALPAGVRPGPDPRLQHEHRR